MIYHCWLGYSKPCMNSVLKNKPQRFLACSTCRAVPGCIHIPAGIVSLETKGAQDMGYSKSCTILSRNGGWKSLLLLECIQQFASGQELSPKGSSGSPGQSLWPVRSLAVLLSWWGGVLTRSSLLIWDASFLYAFISQVSRSHYSLASYQLSPLPISSSDLPPVTKQTHVLCPCTRRSLSVVYHCLHLHLTAATCHVRSQHCCLPLLSATLSKYQLCMWAPSAYLSHLNISQTPKCLCVFATAALMLRLSYLIPTWVSDCVETCVCRFQALYLPS